MRIAMFTETWLPARDGVVTSLAAFRKGLEGMGHEVYIFAAGSHEAAAANTDPRAHIFGGRPWKKYPDYHLVLGRTDAPRLVRDLKIELIHAHGPGTMGYRAVRIAKRARIPVVFTYHTRVEEATGYLTDNPRSQRRLQRIFWRWNRWLFKRADIVVAPTDWVRDDLAKKGVADPAKLRVVPTGIDAARFAGGDAGAARAKYRFGTQKVVVTVGRVAPEKNLETLLTAAEAIAKERDDVLFAIGGKGPALAPLTAEADRRGLGERVKFLGFVPDDDLPSLYHAGDAFVSPSTFETQGLAMLEAMAAGLPVAVADTGGPTHFIEADQNGFMFPGKDAAACAAAIRKALNAGSEVRNRARQTAERFSIERQAKAMAEVYEALLKARGATSP